MIKDIGKVYMTDSTFTSRECSKIDDSTYMTQHAYCNYLYTDVRKLSQEELDDLGFSCQQYEAHAYEYTKADWEASQYSTMESNKETIDEIVTEMIPVL